MKRAERGSKPATDQTSSPGVEARGAAQLPPALLQRKISRRIQRKADASQSAAGPELYHDPDPKAPPLHYQKIEGQAFINKIEASDVVQGSLGDCGFMAALAAVAATSPETIRSGIKPLGNGVFLVRLYRKQWAGMGKEPSYVEQWLALNSDMPVTPSGQLAYGGSNEYSTSEQFDPKVYASREHNRMVVDGDGDKVPADAPHKSLGIQNNLNDRELWPSLYEKAATGMPREWQAPPDRAKWDKEDGPGARGSEHGGYDELRAFPEDEAFAMITGRPAKSEFWGGKGGGDVFDHLSKAVGGGKPATASVLGDPSDVATDGGLYPGHVYTVLAIEGGEVVLRNPWGFRLELEQKDRLAAKKITFPDAPDGVFRLTRAQFLQSFAQATIGGRPQKVTAP